MRKVHSVKSSFYLSLKKKKNVAYKTQVYTKHARLEIDYVYSAFRHLRSEETSSTRKRTQNSGMNEKGLGWDPVSSQSLLILIFSS